MNVIAEAKYFTLDWDRITIEEAKRRYYKLVSCDYIQKAYLSLSPTKGFHVRVHTNMPINIAHMRNIWKDDGRRLVNDILNRDCGTHDILWTGKVVHGIRFKEKHLIGMQRFG